MSGFEYPDRELSMLAVLGEAIIADPTKSAEMIEMARNVGKDHTPHYLGVLATIETVCQQENGQIPSREEIAAQGLELVGEQSVFRAAGVTITWAAECWLNRKDKLTQEQQALSDQIAFWRETEIAQVALAPK